MSRDSKALKPLSLAQHFDAPEDYTGHFGWLCGYSADALFLDDAVERFTRLTRAQRAHQGLISIAAFLDPGNPPISLLDAPGVAHLPIRDNAKKPFSLLHAKVALLGFRHNESQDRWQLRLLVSTGNWTRQTLEESLDLIWRIDTDSASLTNEEVNLNQDCADIKEAWDLMGWLQTLFDTRLLNAEANSFVSDAQQQVSQWIDACSKRADGRPRFFDNRSKSLLDQLPEKIRSNGAVERNYLAMGSGFYETSNDPQEPPEVPLSIIKRLRDTGLLAYKSEVELYVNPNACQSVATSLESLRKNDVRVHPAAIPTHVFGERVERSLHAKFLFSANFSKDSNSCTSAWVYLGSGNLTHPGFSNKMSSSAGNLEAGVVFNSTSSFWKKSKDTPEHQVVTNLLPIQPNGNEISDAARLNAGSEMEQRDVIYVVPPIAWLKWYDAGDISELRTETIPTHDFEVLNPSMDSCEKTETGFQWLDSQPREVCIRWQENEKKFESLIPVIDQYGRIAATKLPAIDIEEAWWQLADFPMPPDEEGGDVENGEISVTESKNNAKSAKVPTSSYPIRQMMELIESIAAKQTEIDEKDWALWCNRLEQTLGQASGSDPVKCFRDELKLNPLSPLHHQPFRPAFAESNDTQQGKLYHDALLRVEENWRVKGLIAIGDAK